MENSNFVMENNIFLAVGAMINASLTDWLR